MAIQPHILRKALAAIVEFETLAPESQQDLVLQLQDECEGRLAKGMPESEALAEGMQAMAELYGGRPMPRLSRAPLSVLVVLLVTLLSYLALCWQFGASAEDVFRRMERPLPVFTEIALGVSRTVAMLWFVPIAVAGFLAVLIYLGVREGIRRHSWQGFVAGTAAVLLILLWSATALSVWLPYMKIITMMKGG